MRRALTALAIGIVVGGCSGKSAHPTSASRQGAHATTLGTTAATSEWCVPISRAAATALVMRASDEVPATDTARAKLFGTDYWAVEVEGSVTPAFSHGGHFAWAVFNVDAHTGDIRGMSAGPPGTTPSNWNSLPNRTSNCTRG
jgi:hypothetical protein